MAEKLLECRELRKTFGKKQILKGVNFDLFEGDILGFIVQMAQEKQLLLS